MSATDTARRSMLAGAMVASMIGGGLSAQPGPETAGRPNVLMIVADDMGWGDVRSHGNGLIDTPTLDYLAGSGARFDRFYVSPVCSLTRASLLTGRYHPRTGVYGVTRGQETMRAEETTLAELFRAAGYATGAYGKWHNGAHYPNHPNGQGFDQFFGFTGGHLNNYTDATLQHNGKAVKTSGYISDVLTEEAIAFMRANSSRPFLCYVPFNAPHSPLQVPERWFTKYQRRGLSDADAAVYGMVENIDYNVSRMLAVLDELEVAERTIVVFVSDNGANTDRYDGFMRGEKGSLDEGGMRVPLFIRYPRGIAPGTMVTPIASHIDLLPTLAELCGVVGVGELKLDGTSLVPLLERSAEQWPERMLFDHWGGLEPSGGTVRTERWRAVFRDNWELYDMLADPRQERDVAERYPWALDRLSWSYMQWFGEVTAAGFEPVATELGHERMPVVELPATEAVLGPGRDAGIGFSQPQGWANDWIANWTEPTARASWPVRIVRPGRYRVTLLYAAEADQVGTRLRIEIGDRALGVTVDKAHEGARVESADRVERVEVYERVWGELAAGEVRLEPGGGTVQLVLRAVEKTGARLPEIKAVRVELLP